MFDLVPMELRSLDQWICWQDEGGNKVPKVARTGTNASSTNPADWCDFQTAVGNSAKFSGPGFVFRDGGGLVGIDLDSCLDEAGSLQAWAVPILTLFNTYAEISPSGRGLKLWMRGSIAKATRHKWFPLGKPMSGEKHAAAVEIYASGRYFTFTGNHWPSSPVDVADCQPGLDFVVAAHFSAPLYTPAREYRLPSSNGAGDVMRRAELYISKIPGAVSGQSGHDETFRVACHLTRGFSLGFDDAMTLLSDWNHTCDPAWEDRDLERKITQSIAQSRLPEGYLLGESRDAFRDDSDVNLSGITEQGPRVLEAVTRLTQSSENKFPVECLNVGGIIERIVDHNLTSAMYPMPELALAGALALMSVITGRKVQDRRTLRTNGYYLGLAAAGSGKNFARQLNTKIMFALNEPDMIGPSKLKSSSGLVNALVNQPACLFQLDEISRLLHTMKNPREAPHLYDIGSVMLEAYGESNTTWKPGAYADSKKNPIIEQPHLVVYGTAVPKEFWASLTVDNMTDGLLGRMMVFEYHGLPALSDNELKLLDPQLLTEVKSWLDYQPAGGGNLKKQHPQPTTLQYSMEAWDRYLGHTKAIVAGRPGESPIAAGVWRRTAEKTGKLAILSACSRQPPIDLVVPTIELCDVEWAIRLSNWLTRCLLTQAGLYVAENQYEDSLKRILRMLTDWTSLTEVRNRVRWMKPRDRNELLNAAVADGLIEIREIDTGGRKRVEYRSQGIDLLS